MDDGIIIKAISELNEDKVIKLVNIYLSNGINANDIIKALQNGMENIGLLYEKKEYFITDLMMAGIIFKEVLEIKGMKDAINNNNQNKYIGRLVIGTVKGDLHDIGKDIFIGFAKASGFEIFDLGVDVSPEVFCLKVEELKPDILALCGVLTLAMDYMKQTIDALISNDLRENLKIIVGGNMIDKNSHKYIDADAYTNNANYGIQICKDWVINPRRKGRNKWENQFI
ncbi:cobalamin-binding protein [Alkalibaculum sp. M08DMB]|uniref:Cobalamin-binding protein n=1 Tax=Alkalibaculum sporogenes TaxID=2655001 RepID=A0A6A7K5B2_9FIRM|nr:cobalamin-dependent protein [Alkalibaculum sporogenes]MPW24598.1 cobalamin-binding protein [Alkalibaculum sporogenes]